MKKATIFLFFALLTGSSALKAWSPPPPSSGNHHHHRGKGTVATPLDGGLLTILGAAGIGYFLFRKKNKNKES